MSAKSVRLSPAQQHVLDRMREGWQLRVYTFGRWAAELVAPANWSGPRLREVVSMRTVNTLCGRGLIIYHAGFTEATYTLAAAPDGSTG